MLEAISKCVVIKSYVDANHARNMANRRSHSGIIIYVNNSPIIWYSKPHNTFEASSFGSEFVAIRITTDLIETLRYKLTCFGIPVEVPAEVFRYNISVVKNSSIPTSALNKRHNSICYHRFREAQASGILRVGWIPGEFKMADFFTKRTMPVNTRHSFVGLIFSNTASQVGDIEKA